MKTGVAFGVTFDRVILGRGGSITRACVWVCALLGAVLGGGCGIGEGAPLPNESTGGLPASDYELVARFAHIADPQIVDEESPARLVFAIDWLPAAWRPQERYSCQLLDGMIRAINRHHEHRSRIDFLVVGGDVTDNAQWNELRWFLDIMDGKRIAPLTGVDDRPEALRPEPLLDPHEPFLARGLYRSGIHGPLPSIPWYDVVGNHDRFALGIFPIIANPFGGLIAPLPLSNRVGLVLPKFLNPLSYMSYALITPARPGPPTPSLPVRVAQDSNRRFYTTEEFVLAHFDTLAGPPGHGFSKDRPQQTWYSVSPAPGLRLVTLDTCTPPVPVPAGFYSEGAINQPQMVFLRRELASACDAGELVIVATHHPSDSLWWSFGSAATTNSFRETLNQFPCVIAHLTGHSHRHRVRSHGGYTEIETASTLDFPQEGRVIEVWRKGSDVELRYWTLSHLDDASARLDADGDPLARMREAAYDLAAQDQRVGND